MTPGDGSRPRVTSAGTRVRGILPALLLAALFAHLPGSARAQLGPEEVTSLRFEGNESFNSAALSRAILTRETRCESVFLAPFCWVGFDFAVNPYFFSPRVFPLDLARIKLFYYQRGYREAQVDTTLVRDDDGVAITFHIQEGRPVLVDSLEVVGLEEIDDPAVTANLPLATGRPLDQIALNAARDSILGRLQNRGYAYADVLLNVFIPAATPYDAIVTFDAFTGPRARFGEIAVEGNDQVSNRVIRRMVAIQPGTRYSRRRIFEAQRNLYSLEIFRRADVLQDSAGSPSDTIIPIRVRVAEGDVHRVRTGAGWSTTDCFNTEARWTSRNFFGGARRMQVTGRWSNILNSEFNTSFLCEQAGSGEFGRWNWLLSADFTQPFLWSPRNSISASLFAERTSVPDLFIREGVGFNVRFNRSLGLRSIATFSYQPEISELKAAEVYFCASFLVCDPTEISLLQSANLLAPVGFRSSTSRGNQVFGDDRGYSLAIDLEHASGWTGSDFAYERVIGEAAYRWVLAPRRTLSLRLRSGWLNPREFEELSTADAVFEIAHPQKLFYAGGANSVRGYAQNQLGPRVLFVPDVDRLLRPRTTDGGEAPLCLPDEVVDLTCDATGLPGGEFVASPTGGSTLMEGAVEVRFPLGFELLDGAAFLDFGQVWSDSRFPDLGDLQASPGLGVRYVTPIGPVRFDVAYRFEGGDLLRVVTSQIRCFETPQPGGLPSAPNCIEAGELALLEPEVLFGESDPWSFGRFQIHLSIGQAF